MKASAAPFVPGAEGEEQESEEAQQNAEGLGDAPGASVKAPDPSEVAATNIEVMKPAVAKAPEPDEVPPPAAAVVEDRSKEAPAATPLAAADASKEAKSDVAASKAAPPAAAAPKPLAPKASSLAASTIPPDQARAVKPTSAPSEAVHMFNNTNVWRPQYLGRIRSFSDVKGFGFIYCQETLQAFGHDVFIHRYQMAEGGLKVGQHVFFEVEVNAKGQPQARRVRARDMEEFPGVHSGGGGVGTSSPEDLEEKLRSCSSTDGMWELIEQFGHSFQQKHVVTALYSLGLCRQYDRQTSHRGLTLALVDRLVLCAPRDLSADEASKVLWALAILDEDSAAKAHSFAMRLAEQAKSRFHEFSPSQMATFLNALSRLVRSSEEDELVGKITINFSDYAMGMGANPMPRFPAEELRSWKSFLMEASSGGGQPQARPDTKGGGGGKQNFNLGSPMVNPAMMMGGVPKAGWGNGGMPCWGSPPMQRPPSNRVPMNPMMGGAPGCMNMWQGGGPGKGGKGGPMGMGGSDDYPSGPAGKGGGGGAPSGFPGACGGGGSAPGGLPFPGGAPGALGQSKGGAMQMGGTGPGPGMGGGGVVPPSAGFGGPGMRGSPPPCFGAKGDHPFGDSGGKMGCKGDGKDFAPQNFERRKGTKDKGGGRGCGYGYKDGGKGKGPQNGGCKGAESKGDAGLGKNADGGKGDGKGDAKGDAGRGKSFGGKVDAGPAKGSPAAGGGKGTRASPSPPPTALELSRRIDPP